jgi:hypothetical protein
MKKLAPGMYVTGSGMEEHNALSLIPEFKFIDSIVIIQISPQARIYHGGTQG